MPHGSRVEVIAAKNFSGDGFENAKTGTASFFPRKGRIRGSTPWTSLACPEKMWNRTSNSSLQRLGVDSVDLYWLHRDDPGTPVEEILLTLEEFRKAGKIRYAGFSNWTQARAEAARVAAEKLGLPGFIGSQNQWSLAKADPAKGDPTWAYIDESFAKWHAEYGFAAFPYTSQASGYFRRLDNGSIAKASDLVKGLFHHPPNENRYQQIKALQAETGFSIAQIALGYLLGQSFPVFPIVGPRRVADLEESLSASEVTLTSDQVDFLTAADP